MVAGVDGPGGGAAGRRNRAVVIEHGGSRIRTVDEHAFVTQHGSMRVQVFTAEGLRSVAVVTQTDREGRSLQNGAERYVEEVWQRFCPEEIEPPLFIAHQLLGELDLGFQQFLFTVVGPHTVERPVRWGPMLTLAELEELVGGPVDPDRGDGYVEPEPAQARPPVGASGFGRFAVLPGASPSSICGLRLPPRPARSGWKGLDVRR